MPGGTSTGGSAALWTEAASGAEGGEKGAALVLAIESAAWCGRVKAGLPASGDGAALPQSVKAAWMPGGRAIGIVLPELRRVSRQDASY